MTHDGEKRMKREREKESGDCELELDREARPKSALASSIAQTHCTIACSKPGFLHSQLLIICVMSAAVIFSALETTHVNFSLSMILLATKHQIF